MPLFLRIALELHLKRLLVGGIERVFELGRVYRNEGISPRHNPEFTMLEVYQAYGDYHTMMDLTERLIVDAIAATGQGHAACPGAKRRSTSRRPLPGRRTTSCSHEHTGVAADDAAGDQEAGRRDRLRDGRQASRRDQERGVRGARRRPARRARSSCIDYPASICPLTKRKATNPAVAERFELFVAGHGTGQRLHRAERSRSCRKQLFRTQLAGQKEEDSMAKMDHDFIRALRHGMPPAGGLGIGIDRLVMLLTEQRRRFAT